MTVSKAILEFLKPRKRGEPVCAKQLLHLGNRAAVDQADVRLGKRATQCRRCLAVAISLAGVRAAEHAEPLHHPIP